MSFSKCLAKKFLSGVTSVLHTLCPGMSYPIVQFTLIWSNRALRKRNKGFDGLWACPFTPKLMAVAVLVLAVLANNSRRYVRSGRAASCPACAGRTEVCVARSWDGSSPPRGSAPVRVRAACGLTGEAGTTCARPQSRAGSVARSFSSGISPRLFRLLLTAPLPRRPEARILAQPRGSASQPRRCGEQSGGVGSRGWVHPHTRRGRGRGAPLPASAPGPRAATRPAPPRVVGEAAPRPRRGSAPLRRARPRSAPLRFDPPRPHSGSRGPGAAVLPRSPGASRLAAAPGASRLAAWMWGGWRASQRSWRRPAPQAVGGEQRGARGFSS